MSELLQKITDNYIDDQWDNESLLATLNDLNDVQLQVVVRRIKEVEKKHGECKLRRVNLTFSYLSVTTDHPEDTGVTFDKSAYREW